MIKEKQQLLKFPDPRKKRLKRQEFDHEENVTRVAIILITKTKATKSSSIQAGP